MLTQLLTSRVVRVGLALAGVAWVFMPSIPVAARTGPTLVATWWKLGIGSSGPIDTTGANFLVWICTDCDGVISDSYHNTWHAFTLQHSSVFTTAAYAYNATVGAGHTFDENNSSFVGNVALAFSGVQSSSDPLDQVSQAVVATTALQAGAITPTANDELAIMWAGDDSTFGAIDSGFTIGKAGNTSGCCYASGIAYKALTGGAGVAINPTWTVGSHSWAATLASFKTAGSPPPPSFPALFFTGTIG